VEILNYFAHQSLLRRKCRAIRDDELGSEVLLAFAKDLGETMMRANGAGIAANQVREAPGGEPWRLICLRVGDSSYVPLCNPVITQAQGGSVGPEGCLSFASVVEQLPAPEFVVVDFVNTMGKPGQTAMTDESARAVWHECLHLDGQLLPDRMKPLQRRLFLKAVLKRQRSGRAMSSSNVLRSVGESA
jgi:peptide deformylase